VDRSVHPCAWQVSAGGNRTALAGLDRTQRAAQVLLAAITRPVIRADGTTRDAADAT
jgi:hypothetical protein